MSLKENIEVLKEELSSEEKFFESAVRTERFVKRYQKPLVGGVLALLLAVGGAIVYQTYADGKLERANGALNKLLMNPTDAEAMKTLENENKKLYDVWRLSRGVANADVAVLESLSQSESFGVADIASYELAAIKQDKSHLEGYVKTQGALYKDLALVELAVLLIQEGKVEEAHQKIALIPEDSTMYKVGQMLTHYGVK